MNKLFTKVAALTLGVAMAAGVGVALGSAKVSEAKAVSASVSISSLSWGSSTQNAKGADNAESIDSNTAFYFTCGDANTGKYYSTSPAGARMYQSGNPSITVIAKNSCVLTSVTITYNVKNGGCLHDSQNDGVAKTGVTAAYASGTAYALSSVSSFTAYLANTGTATNGQVAIASVAVEYQTGSADILSVTDSVENGSISPTTVEKNATLTATITPDTGYNVPETVSVTMGGVAATHTYENGVVTVENVTGDIEITGSCVAKPVTPEPDVVETTFADFIAATDADYAKAYHFSATIKAFKSGDTKDKYGNMTLTDGTTDLTVYGSTADATKLVWNGVSEKYEFTNPQDFMTTDLTNDSSVGDTVEVKFVRYYHSSKLNAQGIILSVTPGETPEIPEPEMVTGKKLSDLFADTAGNGKQLYEVTGVVSAWASGKSDATQYGNFYLKESLDSDTEYYIYGATADATKLVWGTASGVYGFSNPKDFLTNEVTKDVVIGSTLTMRLTRCDYNTTLEANGIVVSVVQPTPTDWSNEQKTALETALHGYLPPFFGELAEDMTTTENSAVFTVSGDHSAEFATKLGDGWNLVSDNNYMLVGDNYYLTASIYTYGVRSLPVGDYSEFTFAYHEGQPVQKYTVTYTAGQGTGDNYVVSDVEAGSLHALVTFETAAFTAPEGQQFKGWQVDNDTELRAAGYEVTVSADVTVTAIYEDIPATDWSETFKATFQSKFGTTYLPPFVNAEFAKESNQKWHSTYPYCKIEVEGNFYSNAATLFNNDSNWYFLGYDEYDCPIFMTADQKAFVIIDAYMKVEDGPVYTSLTFECVGDYAVVTTGATLEYYVGDNLDLTNVKLCAQLLDGTIVNNLTIPQSYWSVSPTTLTEAGDEVVITIAVAALEAEFTYNVKVTPVIMESISISGELSKTEYTEGDAWDATGLVATAHYNNGAEEDVTGQVSWTFQPEETVAGTTSVSVVATLDEISSEAANFDVVVNEPAPVYDADAFAKDLLEMVAPICANYDGKKNNKAALKTVWDTMSQRYSTLSNEEKAKVIAAAAKTDGTDLEKAMAFYNYACKKYGLTKFIEGRQVKALVTEHETGNSILPIVVIVASSVAAITAIGVVIALKRRKTLLAK